MIKCAVLLLAALAVCQAIPVNVMLPLDMADDHGLKNPNQLRSDIQKLKDVGVWGVMTDVWWGFVETQPKVYNWATYDALLDIVKSIGGIKLQVVMSFHQCGGNVGDTCDIKLPQWVRAAGAQAFYTDREGHTDYEYISLGADHKQLFQGRSAMELYADFMKEFASHFHEALASGLMDEVQVGAGPCGEARYPSYQMDRWSYCGIGEFQSYDPNMLADLKAAAASAGHPEWGTSGPSNAGGYNTKPPGSAQFFQNGGRDNYASEYGRFFLGWYTNALLKHTGDVLAAAHDAFAPLGVALATKVSGIHWWYADGSHAAELTAGYYNANGQDGYALLSKVMREHNVSFDFTCLEMFDGNDCGSRPEQLVGQAFRAAGGAGIPFHGENALELCNPNCYEGGFNQIYSASTKWGKASSFTYLRLTRNLVDNGNNLNIFRNFINKMRNA